MQKSILLNLMCKCNYFYGVEINLLISIKYILHTYIKLHHYYCYYYLTLNKNKNFTRKINNNFNTKECVNYLKLKKCKRIIIVNNIHNWNRSLK